MRTSAPHLVLLLLLPCVTAGAEEATSEDLAVRANEVHQIWCADIYGAEISEAAAGYQEVSEVWAAVDAHLQGAVDAPLTYWRGVLAQCLGQDERAMEDLAAFLVMVEEREPGGGRALAAMAKDAQRRTQLLELRSGRGDALAEVSVVHRRRTAGGVMLAAGATSAAVGFAINVAMYQEYVGTTDADTHSWASGVSHTGLAVGIIGAVTSAVGLILVIAPDSKAARVSVGPGPWASLQVSF